MADSDKNILITPNRSQAAQPSIAFTGKGNVPITLRVLDDSNGTLSFEGSAGQLFSINNNLSAGTIFSVNDVSGIPMIDVDASGIVRLAPLGGTVYSNTLYAVPRTVAGSGNSVTVRAADGLTSGAGGNILFLPGLQATTGGDGKIIVRQPGGTAGTNEVQMWHDGSQFHIKNFTAVADYGTSSSIILKSSNDFGVQIGRVTSSTVGIYPVGTTNIAIGNPANQTVFAGWWKSNSATGAWEPNNSTYPINWSDVGFYRSSTQQLVVGSYSSGGGSLCYTSSTPSALSTNPTNDLVLTGSAFQRLSSSSALAVTGIAPPSGGAHVDGRVIWLHNVGSFNITLKHDATSTAENRFVTETAGDFILGPRRAVRCTYDTATARWRVIGAVNYPYNFPITDGTSGQVLSTNGSGTLSWATSSGGVSGSGTTNYVTKFTGTSAVGNSQIFDNGTNVGIGTASPSAKLHVVADSALTNPESDIGVYSLFLNSNATTNAGSAIGLGANGTSGAIIVGQRVGANNESVMKLQTRDSAGTAATRVTISSGGNVGIGTTSPSYRLDVAGTIKSAGTGYNTATSPSIYLTNTTATTGRTFIINSANNGAFQVADANASDATRLYLLANGNFGIGNNSSDPGAQLQVTALAAGTKGLIVKGAASQSANLQEWQDSAGNVPISVSSAGTLSIAKSGTRPSYIVLNNTVATESVEVTMQQNGVQRAAFGICGTTNAYILNPPSASDFGFRADNVNILFSMNAGSSVQAMLTSGGRFGVGTSATADVTGMIQANPTSASTKGLVVKAAASQTANLLEIQNSSGTNLVYVDPTGDLLVGVPNATYFPSGAAAPLHVTRPTTAVATAVAAWPTYEPDTQTHARVTAFFTDGGNGGTATVATGTTTIIKFGEYYTGRVVLMPEGAGGQTPADQNSGAGRDIMLLGGKSDNTAGKTGGRVFIQGGTGFAGAYGSNFGNVILQPNGGSVAIGGTTAATDSGGLSITSTCTSALTTQLMLLRPANTNYRMCIGLDTAGNNYGIIQAYINTVGYMPVAMQPNGGSVGIGNTSPGARLQVDTGAAATKGLIVKGAASQNANLQEWQNSGGTVLASADSAGNISTPRLIAPIHSSSSGLQLWHADNVADAASSGISFGYSNWGSGYMPTHWTFKRTLPDTSGNFVELFSLPGQQASYFELTVVAYKHAEAFESKSYVFATQYLTGGGILQPTFSHARSPGYAGFFGNHFEVELNTNVEPAVVRVRRTSTSGTGVAILAHLRGMHLQGITEKTGTGTSSIGLSNLHGTQQVFPTAIAPPAISSGAGNSIGLYAGNGVTSGAGGSIILQPGQQATTGGNGTVVVRQPGGTAGTDEIQLSHDGGKGSIINKDGTLQLGGANIALRNVANSAGTTLTATTIYATSIASNNSTNADGVTNDSYSWAIDGNSLNWNNGLHIRASWSHIKGYGGAGIAYTGDGGSNGRYATLEITDGSSNGGSLAYRSTDHSITANTNNLTPTRFSAMQRWSPTANYNVTGLAAGGSTSFAGGTPTWVHTNGRVIWVHNVSTAYNITLKHEDAGSTAANRFLTETGTDIIMPPNSMVMLTYDSTSARWRVHTLSSAVKVVSTTTNISAATNNLALSNSSFQRLNCTTACNLTGVAPPSGSSHTDGRTIRIYNVGTANLTLKHNSTSSDIANRFCCIQAVDIILAPRDYAELIYDGTDGGLVAGQNNPCWRVA